jgi:predicted small lipoprotein YifL
MCLGMPELAEMAALLTAPGIPQPVELPGDDYNEEEEEEEEEENDDDDDDDDDGEGSMEVSDED